MILRDYQRNCSDAVMRELQNVTSTLVVMPTGCHAAGQGIMLHDGSIKLVEEIQVGDKLMGPDSQPRTVLNLARGNGDMCRIVPVKGTPFVVNLDHILTLIKTNEGGSRSDGEIIDVKVSEWLHWPRSRKHLYKLVRTGCDFPQTQHPDWSKFHPDPYLIGVLLGDGSFRTHLTLTTPEPELVSEVNEKLAPFSLKLGSSSNCGKAECYLIQPITKYSRDAD